VWAAVRPEKIHITRSKPEQPANVLEGVVKEVAYMGDFSIYLVQLGTGKTVRVTQPNLSRGNPERIYWDEKVFLHWEPSSAVVLRE
jgi:putrescine transport system ATP-binding protein